VGPLLPSRPLLRRQNSPHLTGIQHGRWPLLLLLLPALVGTQRQAAGQVKQGGQGARRCLHLRALQRRRHCDARLPP
jgi:hypothetical protein